MAPLTRAVAAWLRARGVCLQRLAVLTAVLTVSVALAGLTWRATSGAALGGGALGAPAHDRHAATLTAEQLTRDLAADHERDLTRDVTGSTSADEADAAAEGAARPAASGIGGPALSAAAAGAVLLAGLVAARLVLRRSAKRDTGDDDAAVDDGPRERPQATPIDDPEPRDMTPLAPRPAVDNTSEPLTAAANPAAQPPPAVGMAPAASGEPSDWQPAKRVDARASGSGSGGSAVRVYEAHERLYERRVAPRIAYTAEGVLRTRQDAAPMTVLDLSETGLRCASTASALPKARDHVFATFDLGGEPVTIGGQVSWRKRGPDGTQLGLQFQRVSEEHSQLLRSVCFANA